MKRVTYALLLVLMVSVVSVSPANADWRWTKPHFKLKTVKTSCGTHRCAKAAREVSQLERRLRIARFNLHREREWAKWTRLFIPDCTWYGESGKGPEYARYRYTLPNSTGSGAYGKFQFKPPTYFASGKYDDWSPLDQEIAARREFWQNGTTPWENCG